MTRLLRRAAAALVLGAVVAAVPPPGVAHADPLVTFRGGYVVPDGDFRLTVQRSGRAVGALGRRERRFTLSPSARTTLRTQVRAARFAGLRRRYSPAPGDPPVAGIQAERITVAGRTVRIDPGARVPRRLARLQATLRRIVEQRL